MGVLNPQELKNPILRGIHDGELWSKTDVYEVHLPLPGDSKTLVFGEVLSGMSPKDPPVAGRGKQSHDADRMDKNLHGKRRQNGPGLRHDAWDFRGFAHRSEPPAAGECLLLGARAGAANQAKCKRGAGG